MRHLNYLNPNQGSRVRGAEGGKSRVRPVSRERSSEPLWAVCEITTITKFENIVTSFCYVTHLMVVMI